MLHPNDSSILRSLWLAQLIEYIRIRTSKGSISSLLTMSIERFEASRKLSTYERSNWTANLKYVVLQASINYIYLLTEKVQLCMTIIAVSMDAPVYGFPTKVPHCTVISVNGRNLQTLDSVHSLIREK